MRILLLHNHYRQAGGEDIVVAREKGLLAAYDHAVDLCAVSNVGIKGPWKTALAAWRAAYSSSARGQVAARIQRFRPDVVHVHNFFPLLTPSVYDACRAAHVPVVQTLHNYRLLCLNALHFRDGHTCEECLGTTVPWPGILHGCYRASRGASVAVASMLTVHRVLGTWSGKVDVYIVPTDFARGLFIRGGLPAHKLMVKPHFVHPDPGLGGGGGGYALFAGRLSPEKGVTTLLGAWELIGARMPLKIVGDGPLAGRVAGAARENASVEWLGQRSPSDVVMLMKDAQILVFPSVSYESFGMVIAEAYAVGLPVIASSIGSASALVAPRRTGLMFRPGDAEDLAAQVLWTRTHPDAVADMRREARGEFESKYTAEQNYRILMAAYDRALGNYQRVA